MQIETRTFRWLIIGLYLLTFIFISKNLDYQYLWFDESGQFWVSKGLNHDSDPLSEVGGVSEVIENNRFYNKDPGGFSILLHFWSTLSGHHIWLRLLPFIFFIGVVIGFVYLSFRWLKDLDIALLMGFIPIIIPLTLNLGFEIRAYSMEILGTVMSVVALEQLKNKLDYKNLLLWSCILAVFITSRYSVTVVVFSASLFVVNLIVRSQNTIKNKLILLSVYSAPLVICLAGIYKLSFSYQNTENKKLVYLQYLSNNPLTIFKPVNFMYVVVVGFFGLLFIARNRYPAIKKYVHLIFLAVAANVFFIVLSYMGIHPWRLVTKNCISMVVLTSLCITFFLGEMFYLLFEYKRLFKYSVLVVLLVFIIYQRNGSLYPRNFRHNLYSDFVKEDVSKYKKVYVECWESPGIRYLYEYGQLKNNSVGIYPGRFTFGKGVVHTNYSNADSMRAWSSRIPKMNGLVDYDLVISSELFDWSSKNNDKWKRIDKTNYFWARREHKSHEGHEGVIN